MYPTLHGKINDRLYIHKEQYDSFCFLLAMFGKVTATRLKKSLVTNTSRTGNCQTGIKKLNKC